MPVMSPRVLVDDVALESGSVSETCSPSRSKVDVVCGPPARPVLAIGRLELTWSPKAS